VNGVSCVTIIGLRPEDRSVEAEDGDIEAEDDEEVVDFELRGDDDMLKAAGRPFSRGRTVG